MDEQVKQRTGRHAPVTQQSTSVFAEQQPVQPTVQQPTEPTKPQTRNSTLDLPYIANAQKDIGCPFFDWLEEKITPETLDNILNILNNEVIFKILKNVYAAHNMTPNRDTRSTLGMLFCDSHLAPVIMEEFIKAVEKGDVNKNSGIIKNLKEILRAYNAYVKQRREQVARRQ